MYQRNDLKHSAMLLATAPSEAEQFSRLGLSNKSITLPNGIEFPADIPGLEREIPPRDSTSVRTALFLSRIHPKKGLGMLVEAWAKVRPQGWKMRVVGPDACGHRQWVESQVKRYDLQKSWTFQDAVYGDDKANAFLSSDLFILPTFSENFGIAVAEALAYRLPVLTTTGAPWQGLIDHRCGWWVAPSVEGITQALAQATSTSSQELDAMGQRGRAWVREEFDWPKIAQRLKEAYELYIP
jgi:glycosyltransferase involved in cell wall biosynthesis